MYKNIAKIEAHNQKHNETYKQGLMEDSDMSYDEIKRFRSGARPPERKKRSPIVSLPKFEIKMNIPSSSKES